MAQITAISLLSVYPEIDIYDSAGTQHNRWIVRPLIGQVQIYRSDRIGFDADVPMGNGCYE